MFSIHPLQHKHDVISHNATHLFVLNSEFSYINKPYNNQASTHRHSKIMTLFNRSQAICLSVLVLHQQGDLDTHGFTILYRARSYIPEWQPVQIDVNIFLGHKPPRMGA
ncbi:Wadjet anti-phage system protein JetD domain-containing protein [Aeromonas allosaccharophila]|uniref:Wadjet anti-phage system protein JetD domain-containing protein n=1 Tax=Aeromonas allosaccharophila TaxID=656 RepID=UPI003AAAC7B5